MQHQLTRSLSNSEPAGEKAAALAAMDVEEKEALVTVMNVEEKATALATMDDKEKEAIQTTII